MQNYSADKVWVLCHHDKREPSIREETINWYIGTTATVAANNGSNMTSEVDS